MTSMILSAIKLSDKLLHFTEVVEHVTGISAYDVTDPSVSEAANVIRRLCMDRIIEIDYAGMLKTV